MLTRFMPKQDLHFEIPKPPKDNLFKDKRKLLKELQSDASIVILRVDKGRSTVILNLEDYLEKCIVMQTMVHTNYLKTILLPKLNSRS